jgi:hypothetical protein
MSLVGRSASVNLPVYCGWPAVTFEIHKKILHTHGRQKVNRSDAVSFCVSQDRIYGRKETVNE